MNKRILLISTSILAGVAGIMLLATLIERSEKEPALEAELAARQAPSDILDEPDTDLQRIKIKPDPPPLETPPPAIPDENQPEDDESARTGECLSGTVVFPDGTPIKGISVYARLINREKKPRVESLKEFLSPRRDQSRNGLPGSTRGDTITESDGSFIIEGLRPGRYEVRTEFLNQAFSMSEAIADLSAFEQEHDSGSTAIRFILPIQLLHVRLRDEDGSPLTGEVGFLFHRNARSALASNIYVEQAFKGEVSMQIHPGRWTIWGCCNRRKPVSKSMTINEGVYESDIELVPPAPDLSGKVRLEVAGSDGSPVKRIKVRLFEPDPPGPQQVYPENYRPIVTECLESETGIYEFPAPAGRFYTRLAAEGSSTIDGIEFPETAYLAMRLGAIEVESGKTTVLPVTMQQGGLIRLILHFDRTGTNFVNISVKVKDAAGLERARTIRFKSISGMARVLPNTWESGVPYLGSRLLAPGTYRLEVKARSYPKKFEIAEVFFTILPDKVTDVEAWITEHDTPDR